jgi:hypothetical protein
MSRFIRTLLASHFQGARPVGSEAGVRGGAFVILNLFQDPGRNRSDGWRDCLHDKSVNQGWEAPHRRRRRGESDEIYSLRLQAMWRAETGLAAEAAAVRRAFRYEETGGWRHEDEVPPPELVPLELVTGWSKASGRPAHRPGLALFGGWRIEEMEKSMRAKG